jgi:hypothetical protein
MFPSQFGVPSEEVELRCCYTIPAVREKFRQCFPLPMPGQCTVASDFDAELRAVAFENSTGKAGWLLSSQQSVDNIVSTECMMCRHIAYHEFGMGPLACYNTTMLVRCKTVFCVRTVPFSESCRTDCRQTMYVPYSSTDVLLCAQRAMQMRTVVLR